MQSDDKLVSAYQNGSKAAFRLLVERYQGELFEFISRRVNSPDDAADLVQKTLMQALLKIDQYKRKVSFKAWLYKIALNLSLNHYRTVERQRIDDEVEVEHMLSEENEIAFACRSTDETRNILSQAIGRLPKRQRLTMELQVYNELTLSEVAEIMGCPLGTVKSNLHHALKALRNELGDQIDDL